MSRRLFTSESVTEGHPDKIADQISDTIFDAPQTAAYGHLGREFTDFTWERTDRADALRRHVTG